MYATNGVGSEKFKCSLNFVSFEEGPSKRISLLKHYNVYCDLVSEYIKWVKLNYIKLIEV